MTANFHHPPSPEILTRLVQGSLRQNLPQATRLWVILHSLYGDPATRLQLPQTFTYNHWRNAFFEDAPKHHPSDRPPEHHSDRCPCAHSLAHWLFNPETGLNAPDWHSAFQRHYPGPGLQDTIQAETRLFGITGKSLKNDLQKLADQGFLQQIRNSPRTYQKCTQLPSFAAPIRTSPDLEEAVSYVLKTEVASFFKYLGQPIRDIQRFSIDLEYIIPNRQSDRIQQLQALLRQLWEQDSPPPIQLTYRSARLGGEARDFIVYPVCVHYFQRAPYLYAWGANPLQLNGTSQSASPPNIQSANLPSNWYDFRLDRCFSITPLTWDDPAVDTALRDRCLQDNAPCPDDVRNHLIDVWGYDIYMPQETLLVRFKRDFYQSYVEGTERESRLLPTTAPRRKQLINNTALPMAERQQLLSILEQHPNDIYREAQIRQGDRNIIMRLRAWGPMVEVLLPTSLRQRMAADIQATWQLYQQQ